MVYCVTFGCNANCSKNSVTCSSFKFPPQPTLLKKWLTKMKPANFTLTKHNWFSSGRFAETSLDMEKVILVLKYL